MSVPFRGSSARGLTLLELLVVLAVVALVIGTATVGWQTAGTGPALRAAEAELASLLHAARGQALRTGQASRFVVSLEATSDAGVTWAGVVQEQPGGGWVPVAPLHPFDPSVQVVSARSASASDPPWPATLVSTFNGELVVEVLAGRRWRCGYLHFSSTGATFGSPQVVLAPVRRSAGLATPVDPARARRFLVRPSGAFLVRAGP